SPAGRRGRGRAGTGFRTGLAQHAAGRVAGSSPGPAALGAGCLKVLIYRFAGTCADDKSVVAHIMQVATAWTPLNLPRTPTAQMDPEAYLLRLTSRTSEGLTRVEPALKQRQVKYLLSCQNPDGSFADREGGADLYYTGFGLRCLAVLDAL